MLFILKQKTAYEVRISDWSSDVCSSDLRRPHQWLAARTGAGPLSQSRGRRSRAMAGLGSDLQQSGRNGDQTGQAPTHPETGDHLNESWFPDKNKQAERRVGT